MLNCKTETEAEKTVMSVKRQVLRNNEYYGTQNTLDGLYAQSKRGKVFTDLMPLITARENILLAYRNIKNNKGSNTAGVDKKTIASLEKLDSDEFVRYIQNCLNAYEPMPVRRVEIPKPNGKKRPLGIPTIRDRIIQQSIKQIIEPIAEAKFYKHSYGFRPLRSAKDAIARFNFLVNKSELHFVIDVDIKSFFDEVNHPKLLKQLYTMGIRDKNLLKVITKTLKSEIKGIGKPEKGTPQGGIISPLLANIVLNELDWWIYSQWEGIKTKHTYSRNDSKCLALKGTTLKECFIVRYADDFKILCRKRSEANKLFIAVKQWLKERLNLEISPDKSHITNLKKSYSEFLGYKFKAERKGKKKNGEAKYVAHSYVLDKAVDRIIKDVKQQSRKISRSKNPVKEIGKLNSYILGVHNYYKYATCCNESFSEISSKVRTTVKNRLKPKRLTENIPIPKYMKELGYAKSKQLKETFDVILLPISYVQTQNAMCSSQLSIYRAEDRAKIHNEQRAVSDKILRYVMENPVREATVMYNNNRISKLCGQYGKCAITESYLEIGNMECHHIKPKSLGGSDEYKNLIWLEKPIHRLIHITDPELLASYLSSLRLDNKQMKQINKFRKIAGNSPIAL